MFQIYIRSIIYFQSYLYIHNVMYNSLYMFLIDMLFILVISCSEFYFLMNKKFYKLLNTSTCFSSSYYITSLS